MRQRDLARGDLPATLEMVSGSGSGRGLLYAIPPGFIPRVTHQHGERVHEGLSLIGQGADTIMPPSRHKSGGEYHWLPGRSPDDIAPAPMPGWLVEMMRPTAARQTGRGPVDGELIPGGKRNTYLARLAGAMRRVGADFEAIHAALASTNDRRCDPPLDGADVSKIATSICRYAPASPPKIVLPTRGMAPQVTVALPRKGVAS